MKNGQEFGPNEMGREREGGTGGENRKVGGGRRGGEGKRLVPSGEGKVEF